MTKKELIEILEPYADDTTISIEWAPGSGNYSLEVDITDGFLTHRGELLGQDDYEDEHGEGTFYPNCLALYPAHEEGYYND